MRRVLPRFFSPLCIAVLGLAAAVASPVAAQSTGDRRLLSTGGGDPSIMILFDTSGSMNWASTCSQADIDAGKCDFLCLDGNCAVPMGGDDPNSKFYQAKEALYQVMTQTPDADRIHWGIATLNQDNLAVGAKHWIYTVSNMVGENGISLPSALAPLFANGTREVFGAISGTNPPFNFGCDRYQPTVDNPPGTCSANNSILCAETKDCPAGDSCVPFAIAGYRTQHRGVDFEAGCYPNKFDAVAVNGSAYQAWPVEKIHRLPKGGVDGTQNVTYYVRTTDGGGATLAIYSIIFRGASTAFEYATTPSFDVRVDIASCPVVAAGGAACTPLAGNLRVTFSRDGDTSFFFWEGVLNRHRSNKGVIQNLDSKTAYLSGYPDRNVDPFDSLSTSSPGSDGVFWASDVYATNTCRGWDPSGNVYPNWVYSAPPNLTNTDTDPFDAVSFPDYNLRFPDDGYTIDLTGTPWEGWQYAVQRGDVIPLDWKETNFQRILDRLAPGGDPASDSDTFKQAAYFKDQYDLGEGFLRLKDENVRPMIAQGLTPLAGWFSFARSWYTGCGNPGQCDHVGWKDIRAAYDPNFNCQKTYVLMITDGDETCDNNEDSLNYYGSDATKFPDGFQSSADQCRYRASFKSQEDVETLVIGFGVEDVNKLQCANTPVVFVYNKEDLFLQLQAFVTKVLEQAASFASAAVPTVQTNILDKTYLSSFTPLNGASVWPGRLDAFLKPLPLDDFGFPDRSAVCASGQQSECFAWDAGDSQPAFDTEADYAPTGFLLQAPIESDITRFDNASLQIGTDPAERRVFFGLPGSSVVGNRQYFRYPDPGTSEGDARPEQLSFEYAWNLAAPLGSDVNRDKIADVIEFTLKEKQGLIDNPVDPTMPFHIQFVLGDIFHSNPIVINPPNDFDFYTKDLYWNTPLCGETDLDALRTARGAQISYSWYSNKNLCRRVMLGVGSDDGQVHFFDGGILRDITPDDPTTPEDERVAADCLLNVPTSSSSYDDGLYDDDGSAGDYDSGTGRELFSFIPDAMMPLVDELSGLTELTTEYGVDGTLRPADVFIDPAPNGGVATCENRTWRTVVLGGYREGGPGYFALDMTQPDSFEDGTNIPQPIPDSPSYVPSCTDGDADACNTFCKAGDLECAALPFPALKWEFQDLDEDAFPADDDGNNVADLAESWSRPLVFRHPVCRAGEDCSTPEGQEDHWYAVFGGGLSESPSNSSADVTGNWLYFLDIETGKIAYKRGGVASEANSSPIVGAVPSDITGVDANADGTVDTLYFGTTAGYVYKVDLGDDPFHLDEDEESPTYGRIISDDVDADPQRYDPFQVFTTLGKPIYLEINAVYVPKLGANAILFGTGNRWDLWNFGGVPGRFYAILDWGWVDEDRDGVMDVPVSCASCPIPLNETKYISVDPDTGSYAANYLYAGGGGDTLPGWYFPLATDDRLITEPFSLSGVTFFTIFAPVQSENPDGVCSFTGESKIFIVNTVTTKGYAVQAGTTTRTRYFTSPTFTSQPYVESSATKNAPTSSTTANADTWTAALAEINADLRKLYPPNARFANYTLDIKTIRSDTGIVFIAPVPVAIEPHNWKEF